LKFRLSRKIVYAILVGGVTRTVADTSHQWESGDEYLYSISSRGHSDTLYTE
jgi:hypothetical protein